MRYRCILIPWVALSLEFVNFGIKFVESIDELVDFIYGFLGYKRNENKFYRLVDTFCRWVREEYNYRVDRNKELQYHVQ